MWWVGSAAGMRMMALGEVLGQGAAGRAVGGEKRRWRQGAR